MTNLEIERWTLEYTVQASDQEYNVETKSEFVFQNNTLSLKNGINPLSYRFHQNYPNPFNTITTLRYDLPEDASVNLIIYDITGKIVKNMVSIE